jgi:pimeloyl-ACP methyl ester carboxylesterase
LHGIAASLHDWDELIPALAENGYRAFALDLLGHGESDKPASRRYEMDWLLEHFAEWMDSLGLDQLPVLVGHSMGGYLALLYARRFPRRVRGLILTNPYYHPRQLSRFLRRSGWHRGIGSVVVEWTPRWLYQLLVDAASLVQGKTRFVAHSLPRKVRRQSATDYKRTAPGVYHAPHTIEDLSPYLATVDVPTLVVWGDRDLTLAPSSYQRLIDALPRAEGRRVGTAGHVVHQANAPEFNRIVLEFLQRIETV